MKSGRSKSLCTKTLSVLSLQSLSLSVNMQKSDTSLWSCCFIIVEVHCGQEAKARLRARGAHRGRDRRRCLRRTREGNRMVLIYAGPASVSVHGDLHCQASDLSSACER